MQRLRKKMKWVTGRGHFIGIIRVGSVSVKIFVYRKFNTAIHFVRAHY